MVQLPEKTDEDSEAFKAGYKTIDEIGRERIKRAADKIKKENPDSSIDLGFKHFTLKELENQSLEKLESFDPAHNITDYNDILQMFGVPTVLTTWLNRDGYGLNPNVREIRLVNCNVYVCSTHIYLLDCNFFNADLKELCRMYSEDSLFSTVTNIVVFGYSFSFSTLQALQDNVKKFSITRNSRINIEIRY